MVTFSQAFSVMSGEEILFVTLPDTAARSLDVRVVRITLLVGVALTGEDVVLLFRFTSLLTTLGDTLSFDCTLICCCC